jgi:UDP-glucose 4-epimerase
MKAIVTGGAGFIGSYLSELLIEAGHEVIVIDNLHSGRLVNLKNVESNTHFCFIKGDIRDASIKNLFQNVDWVFHLAGLADIVPSIENPREYFEVNVQGTLNILECCRAANVKRFIYAASSSCYGIPDVYPTPETSKISPQYPYALTKFLGEQLVLHWGTVYGLPSLSLRLFNVYGPRSRTSGAYGAVFGVFLTQKVHEKPFTVVGDGTQTRDFTYVTDVASAFLEAATSGLTGEVFNVGSSHHYSILRLVELLKGEIIFIPKRPKEPDCTFADVKKIETLLGWKARVSLEEGVSRLLNCIEEYKDAPLWNPENIGEATASWFHYLDTHQKGPLCC